DGGEIRPTQKNPNKKKPSSECQPSEKWVIIRDQHEPIVEPELFDKVQQLLAANRPRKSPSRKKDCYPFSQVLRCSNCGATLYGTKWTSGGVAHAIYRCGSHFTSNTCGPRTVRESVVREIVGEVLRKHLLNPDERERLLAEIRK